VIERLRRPWDRFWFQPLPPISLIAARTIVAANALWILLSLRDLPDIVAWPPEFWASVDGFTKLRFFVGGLPTAAEYGLYALLHLALLAALFGFRPRLACLLSGLLLYHFAPLQEIFIGRIGPFFGGMTLPTLALLLLAVAPTPKSGAGASPEFGWPLRMMQVLLTFNYFFAGYSKLFYSGLSWMTADNIQETVYRIATWGPTPPPLAAFAAAHRALCWAIAIATIPLELLFPLVLFSRTAARVLVPATLIGHLLVVPVFGLFFYNMPLLLLFADWDAAARWLKTSRLGVAARRARVALTPGTLGPGGGSRHE
jgi:hypothetical protein